jgi:hypothetical protein
MVDNSDRKVNLLPRFLNQGKGQLSKRARTNEFDALTDEQVRQIEELYHEKFAGISWRESEEPEIGLKLTKIAKCLRLRDSISEFYSLTNRLPP